MKQTAKAKVQITLEVETGTWGDDCSIGQLYKQAANDGLNAVRKLVSPDGNKFTIIGEPKVIGIITEKD
jgi:hypothetical protein